MAETTNKLNQTTTTAWGTLEELLLACAVNRYGTTSWDSVSRELQKRISPPSFTPHICHQKYLDLKRRFSADQISGDDTSLWLHELRKLRVAELRRELQRYDLSIVSLQSKVKRLEEERKQGLDGEKEERENPDLQNNQERERHDYAENDPPATVAGGESDRRNNSFNESNSSDSEPEPVGEPESNKSDRVTEPAVEEDSCNESSNSKEANPAKGEERERVDSTEFKESVAESKGSEGGGVKESSDVLSTASLWRREKNKIEKKARVVSGNSSGEENQSAAVKSASSGESQPLIDLVEVVRVQGLGSVFQRRFECKETPKYRSLVREHIDLRIIQRRLEEGQYADCHTKFYRDLMLLVNNAIVFFSDKSSEYKAAVELRDLVTKQSHLHLKLLKSQPLKPNHNPTVGPPKPPKSELNSADRTTNIKPKLAITGPVIACRKRSSIAAKPSIAGEKKESASVTPKTSSSFTAVTKKRTRDQSIGAISSSSKINSSSNKSMCYPSSTPTSSQPPGSSTPAPAKGDKSEPIADKKKPSPSNSLSKVKRGSGSGNGSLLDLLKKSVDKKHGSRRNEGSNKGERRNDRGSGSVLGSKAGKEKGKAKEEGVDLASKSTGRLTKRVVVAAVGRKAESLPKKRQRK